jgi:hypothetical protein
LGELRELESGLLHDLEAHHGKGSADSPGFRQFMAEYEVSFPTANLDAVREVSKTVQTLAEWLNSPAGWSAFETTFVLLGSAGAGKTHGVCDAAARRLDEGRLSVVTFGHLFGGEPDPWTRIREHLGLPGTLGRDGLLDALSSAAEASGHPLIIWVDAINETKPRRFWRERLLTFADAVSRRPFLRLCVTCRTSFAPHCVPEDGAFYSAEHRGFAGIEQEACRAFFAHYDLDPPVVPILQPELSNPLYLSLICKTLRAKGLRSLPTGWVGLSSAISAFLSEKNRAFALEYDIHEGTAVVPKALSAIAREIARLGETGLSWSAADHIIRDSVTIATALQPLDWLVREDLLIEDAPTAGDAIDAESVVRPAFERLGDFLIAQELLSGMQPSNFRAACTTGGRLAPYFGSQANVTNAEGIIGALSILVPEQFAPGTELPDLFDEGPVQSAVLKVAVSSYIWRDPASFTAASAANLRKALGMRGFAYAAMDAALGVCSQPSTIDANWLHTLLSGRPMATRDAFWCGYLHRGYEERGTVWRLINAAHQLPISSAEDAVAERWATALLWITAAADRRAKDCATRAAIVVLRNHTSVLPHVLRRMIGINDDAVRERALLIAYGVCLLTRDTSLVASVCDVLVKFIAEHAASFHNALLRDHVRVIAELAGLLKFDGRQKELISLLDALKSTWPLQIPTEAQIKEWGKLPKLAHSCLDDDFFVYSMGCLGEWTDGISKRDMGKWILRRIVEDFQYLHSGCENYDQYMLSTYGGGRSKPSWAERIGKKYQWIAMYELASRLSDHLVRKRNSWAPDLLRKPLILAEERQFDPTLPPNMTSRTRKSTAWWIPVVVDLSASADITDKEWVQKRDDVPSLTQLVMPIENGAKQWQLLNGYPTWGGKSGELPYGTPYRQLWVQVRGFLVERDKCEEAFARLAGRNFFGRWMPDGATWLHGFVGEYPWAAPFNTEPEWYHGSGRGDSGLPCEFLPVYVDVVAEWEYDASLPEYMHIGIPARAFFERDDILWNGQDSFQGKNKEIVMRVPSVSEDGPSALIAAPGDLRDRLKRLNKRLVWTLLGEKLIIGSPHDTKSPRCTFSQVAMLGDDGAVRCSELTFFDDYRKDTGPLQHPARSGPGAQESRRQSDRAESAATRGRLSVPRRKKSRKSNRRKKRSNPKS